MNDNRTPDWWELPEEPELLNLEEFPEEIPDMPELPSELPVKPWVPEVQLPEIGLPKMAFTEEDASPVFLDDAELEQDFLEEPEESDFSEEEPEEAAPPAKKDQPPMQMIGWTFKKEKGKAAQIRVVQAPVEPTPPEPQADTDRPQEDRTPSAEEIPEENQAEAVPEDEETEGEEDNREIPLLTWEREDPDTWETEPGEEEADPEDEGEETPRGTGWAEVLRRLFGITLKTPSVPEGVQAPKLRLVKKPPDEEWGEAIEDPTQEQKILGIFRREPEPDISPKVLAVIYGNQLGRRKALLLLTLPVIALLVYLNLSDPLNLPVPTFMWDDDWLIAVMLELLGLEMLLLGHGAADGILDLFRGKPGLHTLGVFACLFTALDCGWQIQMGREGPLPCVAATALVLYGSTLGLYLQQKAQRTACRSAALVDRPGRLSLFRQEGQTTDMLLKYPGDNSRFGSQIQERDGVHRATGILSMVVLVMGVSLAVMISLRQGDVNMICWRASVILTLATPLGATLAYGLPWCRVAERTNRSGGALAGWDGVVELKEARQLAVTDDDLFPTGMIVCNGIQTYGKVRTPLVVGYAATLAAEAGGGLADAFDKLLYSQGARTWNDVMTNFTRYDGGYGGNVGRDRILLGTADFMHRQNIPLPEGISVRTAVFCALNDEMAAQFAMIYKMPTYVQPAMAALAKAKYRMALAVKDFNLNPQVLGRAFNLPMEKLAYPLLSTRIELSQTPEEVTLGALLGREGLDCHCDALLQAGILYKVARKNTRWMVVTSLVGLALGVYLTTWRAFVSLQPQNILIYVLLWLVPCLLNAHKVNHVG